MKVHHIEYHPKYVIIPFINGLELEILSIDKRYIDQEMANVNNQTFYEYHDLIRKLVYKQIMSNPEYGKGFEMWGFGGNLSNKRTVETIYICARPFIRGIYTYEYLVEKLMNDESLWLCGFPTWFIDGSKTYEMGFRQTSKLKEWYEYSLKNALIEIQNYVYNKKLKNNRLLNRDKIEFLIEMFNKKIKEHGTNE